MSTANRRFARHYLEMVVVMLIGMEILGMPLDAVPGFAGTGPMLIKMTVAMTLPMVAWMRYRGHAWLPCFEMGASMVIPAAGTLALLGGGIVEGAAALMIVLHAVMLPSMLAVMLYRRDEYSCHHGSQEVPV
jgi:hypothetical protein